MNVSNLSYINNLKGDSYFIAYFPDTVWLGFCKEIIDKDNSIIKECIIDGKHKDDFGELQQFHIFNSHYEIRGMKTRKQGRTEDFNCQVVYKSEEEELQIADDWIDEKQLLIANRWKLYNCESDLFLKIRNYIKYNKNGMVQIVDYRLLGFVTKEGKELEQL